PGVCGGHEVRQLPVYPSVGTLNQAIARFDVAAESIDEGGKAIDVCIVVIDLVLPENAPVVHVVECGEKCDVEIGKPECCRVFRWKAHGATENGVIRPNPILQEQRKEAHREGQVEP